MWGSLSYERTVLSLHLMLVLASTVILRSEALGSFFIASYDLLGYSGHIGLVTNSVKLGQCFARPPDFPVASQTKTGNRLSQTQAGKVGRVQGTVCK
jgi:hypothetical protein